MAEAEGDSRSLRRVLIKAGGRRAAAGEEANAIRLQLERIVTSPAFRNSRRNSALLTYLVDKTLKGRAEELKERTIGLEVFGRRLDYDTSADHVVRSAGSEIRKRLAQYYVEPGHEDEIRIELHPGSYVPQFRMPGQEPLEARITGFEHEVRLDIAPASPRPRGLGRRLVLLSVVSAAALMALGVYLSNSWRAQTALDRFWSPFVAQSNPVLVCIGNSHGLAAGDQQAPERSAPAYSELAAHLAVNGEDAITLARLTGTLQARGKEFRVLVTPSSTFYDLRGGPVILIGGFNNDWVLRLFGTLRFRLDREPLGGTRIIQDTQKPARVWSPIPSERQGEYTKDYGIVARCRNPETGHIVVVIAGTHPWGTAAASEFLTSPDQMKKLVAQAPGDWESKNLQVVLSTDVVRGVAGPPNIVVSYFW